MAQQKYPGYTPTEVPERRKPTVTDHREPGMAIFKRPENMLGKTKFRQKLDVRHLQSE